MTSNWDLAVAERPAGNGPGEDRWLFWESPEGVAWAAVIDGASTHHGQRPDGGDYADAFRRAVLSRVAALPSANPVDILAAAIADTTAVLELPKPSAPSASVGIVRLTAQQVEVAILGDVSVVLLHDKTEQVLRDDRLGRVAPHVRSAYKDALRSGHGFDRKHEHLITQLRASEAAVRNSDTGYWIAADSRPAARHAHTLTHSPPPYQVVLASDGAAAAIKYRVAPDWRHLAKLVERDPDGLVHLIRSAEQADANGSKWPRSKQHDDITAMVVSQHA